MAQINLFFLRQGHYECVITTKEEISLPYDRKITVELEGGKVWRDGTMVGSHGTIAVPKQLLPKMTDDRFLFIDCRKLYDDHSEVYLALEKKFTDGGEYYSKNLEETINDLPCNLFFFPAYLLKFKRGTVPKNEIIGQAHSLGLRNKPSPQGADCCFIENGWITFGEMGCTLWYNPKYTEITEEEFMKLADYFPHEKENEMAALNPLDSKRKITGKIMELLSKTIITKEDVGKIFYIDPAEMTGKVVTQEEFLKLNPEDVGGWTDISEFNTNA